MIGKILGNRYEILEKIGGGGMSVVYKARCRVLNRFVAIKVLRQELTSDPDFIEKFKQESLSAASLTHPNIVNIYDTGIENDIYYIVMEYVKGETLKNYIKKKGKLSEQETIKISRQIAEALKHAHANKIVHRDIKPDNILMTDEGVAKVTDFGIARASTSSTINSASNVIGSVHYFSPEQARGGYVDEKSDIYSLGVVMYEMITGQVPFDADNHISVAMKQIQEKAVPPSERSGVSPKLEEIIMKCLEKHQSYRFQNIDEYLNALKAMGGYAGGSLSDNEAMPDSPTITMSKIDDLSEEKNVIDIRLIDESSDKAFRSFFGEEDGEISDDKKRKNKKSKKKKDIDDNRENNDESEDGGRKNVKITVLAIVSALAVAVLGGILGFKAIFYVPEVSVPNILGKSEEEARKMIEELDLVFKVENREYSNEYDEGEVMEQSQEEGTKLKKDYPIEVVISKGKKEIKVPSLVGKYAIDAASILADMGLQEGTVKDEYSPTVPSGQIISQNPVADSPAELNDKVDFVISKGPKISVVVMPRLVGSSIESAKIKILQNGLTVGQVVEENSDEHEAGIVMNQSVPDGQEVEVGTSIWMTVSKGPVKEEPENPGTENPGTDKSYPLTISLPSDKDSVSVVVQRVTADGREVIYSKDVKTSEQSIIVNVEGTGTQVFEIYIDNTLYDRAEITFD